MRTTFYITTPIFYPNANLHMGHAYTTTLVDIIARYHRLCGDEVYFLTGADENTQKIVRAAKAEGKNTEEYLDVIISNFKGLFEKLDISYDQFIRTSDRKVHWPGAEEMWRRLQASGDIEKRSYKGLYCVGHEAFITEKELVDGNCPEHGERPQEISEENYFFRLSKYTTSIKKEIESGKLQIIPETRKNEILALLDRGLEDVSFSRPAGTVSVGVPVPGDPTQKIYVWCDALVNYLSALGFGRSDDALFKKFWPADAHVIGKDILRFHAAIWPAMLLAAKLPLPQRLLVHGFLTSGGKKMSKTLGNVIDPSKLIAEYGGEAVRWFLARHISPFEDGDVTLESFKEAYNADLANGIGNLTSRIMRMAQEHLHDTKVRTEKTNATNRKEFSEECQKAFDSYNIQRAAEIIGERIAALDRRIQETAPFKLVKQDKEKGVVIIQELVRGLSAIAQMLQPILPQTSEKIQQLIQANKMPEKSLFPRI